MAYIDDLLGNGEEKLFAAHPHWTVLVRRTAGNAALTIILIAIGIIAKVKLGPSHSKAGLIVLFVFLVAALLFYLQVFVQFLRWRNEHYIITDHRVIQLSGLLGKHSIDSSLNMINDLVMNQTVFGRMLNYGDMEIVTGNDVGTDTLEHVADPLAFKRAVLAARDAYAERTSGYHAAPQPIAPVGREDAASLIAKLADLRDRGAISQAEYDAKRAELLNRI
ncbi:MAG: PH domain-containing protein [Thermomicrobia bacterium]|nr:PH domain-containing protein [Thermomicrobia bacterium]